MSKSGEKELKELEEWFRARYEGKLCERVRVDVIVTGTAEGRYRYVDAVAAVPSTARYCGGTLYVSTKTRNGFEIIPGNWGYTRYTETTVVVRCTRCGQSSKSRAVKVK